MEIKKDILWRVGFTYFVMVVFALAIIARIFHIQYIQGEKWRAKTNEIAIKDIIIEPNRGNIVSSDGKLLAITVPIYEIRIDMRADGLKKSVFMNEVDSLAYYLSELFNDRTAHQYKNSLIEAYKKGNRYYLVKKNVSYSQLKTLKEFPIFRLGQYKGGLICVQENKRVNPFGSLALRTIGSVSKQRTVVGIEGAYDLELKGVQGVKLMQRIAGNIWMPVHSGNEVEPLDGKDIITTIDAQIQDVTEAALLRNLQRNDALFGCAIVMEVETGEVKAIANLTRLSNGRYIENLNYAVGHATEPGSTFKLASIMVALEDGYIKSINDSINTGNGEVKYYGYTMRDSREGGYGRISMREVFEYSSNVGISKLIVNNYQNHPNRFINRLYKMRLNQKLGVEIKGEGMPNIKDPTDTSWSGLTLPWMSIGYEVKLTPLQILAFYNAVANNGVMVKPRFIREIQYKGKTIKRFRTEVLHPSICSKKTLEEVQEMLIGVVENGTARNLRNPNYKIAGKTGTAQVAQNKKGYFDEQQRRAYQASFVGYFPAESPKYSCIVVINSPSRDMYYGNIVAGPVFKEIADKIYATKLELHDIEIRNKKIIDIPNVFYGYQNDLEKIFKSFEIPFDNEAVTTGWAVAFRDTNKVKLENRILRDNQVPNVIGMGLRDALYILENNGLQVRAIGKGRVIRQSLNPGNIINKKEQIIIQLG